MAAFASPSGVPIRPIGTAATACSRIPLVSNIGVSIGPGHGEEQPLDVDGEELIEVLLADRPERGDRCDAGVGEQDVEAPFLLLHRGVQTVEVREVRDVALHAGVVPADSRYRFIEFRLPASGDEDVGALGDEPPGGGQADAAVAAGDDRDFPFQFL